jgi:acyl CoA:acetate/3-ketoacid CoA transferase alpha subunit
MGKFSALEIEMATVQAELKPLKEAVTNFRSLDRNVNEFMTEFRTQRKDSEKALETAAQTVAATLSKSNFRRENADFWFRIIIGILMLLIAIATLHREWKASGMEMPKFYQPKTTGQLLTAHNQTQEADTLPPYKEGYTR